MLDLYVCLRPVRYFTGVPSPVKRPEKVDMVIFRENTEDIYAGIEWAAESPEAKKVIEFLQTQMGVKKIRFPETSGIGIKPVSREGTERLIRAAIEYAIEHKRKSVTLVHKGNIMKFTEGAFRDWGYELAKREFGGVEIDGGPWCKLPNGIVIKDAIADITLQQVLTRPEDFDVIATLEPQRRLPVRRARGAGRRHRHRARRQHQLQDRPRDLRGHARHRAEVRRSGQGQPGLGHPLGRDDARAPGLGRGGRRSSSRASRSRSPTRPSPTTSPA